MAGGSPLLAMEATKKPTRWGSSSGWQHAAKNGGPNIQSRRLDPGTHGTHKHTQTHIHPQEKKELEEQRKREMNALFAVAIKQPKVRGGAAAAVGGSGAGGSGGRGQRRLRAAAAAAGSGGRGQRRLLQAAALAAAGLSGSAMCALVITRSTKTCIFDSKHPPCPLQPPQVPVGVDPKSMLCEFFRHGQCQKGFKCKFSHDFAVERKTAKIDLYSDRCVQL